MKFNYFLGLGIFLSLTGASLLVALGILYVKPYMYIRHFKESQCNVTSSNKTDLLVPCQCSSDGSMPCTSSYPCSKVLVSLNTPEGWLRNVTLYDTFETYSLQHNTLQCSYHKCSRYDTENLVAVNAFLERVNKTLENLFPCFYENLEVSDHLEINTNSSQDRIRASVNFVLLDVVSFATVVNSIFWPSLALVIGFVIFSVEVCRASSEHNGSQGKQRSPFSSLERQWARIRERSYGHHHHIASERLVCSDRVDEVGHVAHVIG